MKGSGRACIARGGAPLALFGAVGYGALFLFAAGMEGFGPTAALLVALLVGMAALLPLGLLYRRVAPRWR